MIRRSVTLAVVIVAIAISSMGQPQGQGQGRGPNLSPEEQNLARNIMSATDPAAKMKAVAELIKKYPKTAIRSRVAHFTAEQISGLKDANQKLSLAQQYQTIFNQPEEEELIVPVLIEAYADTNQADEAFARGADFLAKHPDSLDVLVDLVSIGTNLVKKQNGKYLAQSTQYATHAIELIEADKKPASFDDARWTNYKSATLPGLYQSRGLFYLAGGKRAEAKAQYSKAAQLAPTDAFNLMMLAGLANQEYQNAATRYQAMPPGAPRDAELKRVQQMLDEVIDSYAHAIALAEGNPALQQIRQQYLQDLESYYKYRHNGSTDGMQQMIDKYKAAKP